MIPRKPPDDASFERDALWERTREFDRYVRATLADPDAAAIPADLTEGRRISIEAEVAARRWGGFSRGEYREELTRAMKTTKRHVVAPISDKPIADFAAAMRQPEGAALYRRIISSVDAWPSVIPGLHFSLGVLLYFAGGRVTAHLRPAYDIVVNSPVLTELISELARGCDGKYRCEPAQVSYNHMTRLLPRLCDHVAAEVHVALADIATVYRSWGIPVGRHLIVDGSLVPAWVPQQSAYVNGKWDQEREDELRRLSPHAGYVVQTKDYEPEGLNVRDHARDSAKPARTRVTTRRVRGYRNTTMVDVATGLVLATDLRDATKSHEPWVLREILVPRVLAVLPDIDITAIVGDGRYDDDPTHEHLETRYGIHLIAGRKPFGFAHRGERFKEAQHRSIREVRGDGVAICRAHALQLAYKGLEPTRKRIPTPIGEPVNPRLFHSRFSCPAGCGKPSVPTRACWSNLPFHPHTPYGRLDLFAVRTVLLHRRRNQIESVFSAQQSGYKKGTDGADRVRLHSIIVYEAIINLTNLTRGLFSLLGARMLRGEAHLAA